VNDCSTYYFFGNITFEEGWIAVCSGMSHQFQLESLTLHFEKYGYLSRLAFREGLL